MQRTKQQTYIGLDLGQKTVGIAMSDPTNIIAIPLTTIRFQDFDFDSAIIGINTTIEPFNVLKIICGIPILKSGDDSQTTKFIKEFINKIKEAFPNTPVIQISEVYSTKNTINKSIDKDLKKDEKAAAYILQSYLQTI